MADSGEDTLFYQALVNHGVAVEYELLVKSHHLIDIS